MLRFSVRHDTADIREQKAFLREQLEGFLHNDTLSELLSVLGVDRESIFSEYNYRAKAGGRVIETQELERAEVSEDMRNRLFGLFRELGFIDINKPQLRDYSRIVVLGASYRATWDRTAAAAEWVTDTVRYVDGLSCYRPINPVEREAFQSDYSSADTEFGVMSDAFERVFSPEGKRVDRFFGDRNINRIACIRSFETEPGACGFRVFAAPSTEPAVRRADTGDSLVYYLDSTESDEAGDGGLLFVTNNRYCNRQFLQIVYEMARREVMPPIDIIGCLGDDRLYTNETYDPMQYVQDLIAMLTWTERLLELV